MFSKGPALLSYCQTCSAVSRLLSNAETKNISTMYQGSEYATKREDDHTIFISAKDAIKEPFRLQADILMPVLPKTGAAVLDIGCADAALLMEIGTRQPTADLCGFDLNPYHNHVTGAEDKIRFVSGETISAVDGAFDLIVLSHSLQYIRDVPELMSELARLLNPEGTVFIQVPDFAQKPASLLYGDLYYHYTAANLPVMAAYHGFGATTLNQKIFSRDVLCLLRRDNASQSTVAETAFANAVAALRQTVGNLISHGEESGLGVLGTTIEGALADNFLGNSLAFFVDENPKKAGGRFCGKPVVHPRDIAVDAAVLLPYGRAAFAIKRRFEKLYPGRYISI